MDNLEERFPIVDEEGTVVGVATRGECHNGSRLLHPVVHLHVFNEKGDLYLQKRPEWKDIQPGKGDTAVGGHMDYGETPEDALIREVREELGICDFTPVFMGKYVFDSQRERELVYVNRTTYDGPIKPSADELDGGRFWTIQEIHEAMARECLRRTSKKNSNNSSVFTNKFVTLRINSYLCKRYGVIFGKSADDEKGSRWESCTVPQLYAAVMSANNMPLVHPGKAFAL